MSSRPRFIRSNTKASRLTGWLEQTGRYPHGRAPLKLRRNEGSVRQEMSAMTFFAIVSLMALSWPFILLPDDKK